MTEDKEVEAINQKKLKEKGAKIVEEQKRLDYESIVFQAIDFLNSKGLELMNASNEIKSVVMNERQKALQKRNQNDSEKQ